MACVLGAGGAGGPGLPSGFARMERLKITFLS